MITHEINKLFRFSGRTEERIEKQKQIINHPSLTYKTENLKFHKYTNKLSDNAPSPLGAGYPYMMPEGITCETIVRLN